MSLESIEKYTQAYGYPAGYPWVREMVNDIEREVAGRYMELPVDADGVPCRVGDVLDREGSKHAVMAVDDDCVWFDTDRREVKAEPFDAWSCRHAEPDTWERVVRDAMLYGYVNDGGFVGDDEDVRGLVARCEALAGEGGAE